MEHNTVQDALFGQLRTQFSTVFDKAMEQGVVWSETPVSFRVFVEDKEHMDFPPLSERQYAVADFMLYGDITEIFHNRNTMAVLCWGKGSGKDALSCLIILYMVYWLLCLKSPQRFFGLPEGEALDILNVAANAEQASAVFFDKLRQRVIRWQWLRNHYPVKISGVFLGQIKPEDFLNTVVVTKNGVLFPKNIRAFSGHSLESSQEGLNLICFVLDECAAFDESPATNRASKLFSMLRSSATSRFGERWKGFALSFPRYKGDFILTLLDEAESELHWFSDIGATWEIKPNHLFKDYPEKSFRFEKWDVPLEYKKEFEMDANDARGKYCCHPVEIAQAFLEYPEKVEACVDIDRKPMIEFEDYVEDNKVMKTVTAYRLDSMQRSFVLTVDLGLKSDAAAFSGFYAEVRPDGVSFIQGFVTRWIPDKKKGHIVSFPNIEQILIQICEKINVLGIFFDQWNSAYLTQKLSEKGIRSEVYRLAFQDYKNWKEHMYTGKIRLLNYPPQVVEAKRLIIVRAERVDHPADGSKDIIDTQVGAVKLLLGNGTAAGSIPTSIGGDIITGSNLHTQGGDFI